MAGARRHWRSLNIFSNGIAAMVLATSLASSPVSAQKLYKIVDDQGNISYQDTPPMDESLTVEEKHIDVKHSKLRRDPLPNTKVKRPNSGSRRAVTTPSRAPAASTPDSNELTYQPGDPLPNFKNSANGLPTSVQSGDDDDDFNPISSEALHRHFEEQNDEVLQTHNGLPKDAQETPKPLSKDDISEIVRKLQ